MSGIASGYKGPHEGNQSGLATNTSASATSNDAPSGSDIAGTLPANFSLKNTAMETKGEETTVSNESEGRPGEALSTAGPGGDTKRQTLQSHDIDLPGQTTAGAGTINEAKGISRDDQRT